MPITTPKTSRIARVSPAETAARRQRTGQVLGMEQASLRLDPLWPRLHAPQSFST